MSRLRLFISEYTLLFIIVMVIYSRYVLAFPIGFTVGDFTLRIPPVLIAYVITTVILIISNHVYYDLLTREEGKENPRVYHVIEVEDLSSNYANIIMTYVIGVVSTFEATVYGLIVFFIILIFIYGLYKDSEIIFFNPVLFLLGYRIYKLKVEENKTSIYVIYKEMIEEGNPIVVRHLYQNIYLDQRLIKKKRVNG